MSAIINTGGGGTPSFPLLAPDGSAAAPSYSFSGAPASGMYGGGASALSLAAGGAQIATFNGSGLTITIPSGAIFSPAYLTTSNCAANSVSPAACGSAAAGAFVVPTTTTTYTVNTSATRATSRIIVTPMTFAGNLPSAPTCVPPAVTSAVSISAISAGTSFTLALPSTAGQTCWQYWIVN